MDRASLKLHCLFGDTGYSKGDTIIFVSYMCSRGRDTNGTTVLRGARETRRDRTSEPATDAKTVGPYGNKISTSETPPG